MNHEHIIEITVILTDAQAWEYAQFLKRICFSDYRGCATSDAEAYRGGSGFSDGGVSGYLSGQYSNRRVRYP
jgi:hypothetical protein